MLFLGLLSEQDAIVRTAAARELQMRGGVTYLRKFSIYLETRIPETREIAAFILGQIGTPKMPFKDESLPTLLSLADDEDAGFDQPLLLHLDICAMKVCLSM
ncbi:hypothetical protein ACPA9J_31210 [Pseudomonas aeruginosa]